MKSLLILLCFLFAGSVVAAQLDSTKLFESSKGKWPIPVTKYIKVFDNEELKTYTTNLFDSSLRIITDSSYNITAVHDGTVIGIIEVENEYTIVTKFGNYFIVYGKLMKPNLKKGDFIMTGQSLGQLTKYSSDEQYTLEINLFKKEKELCPKKWIKW